MIKNKRLMLVSMALVMLTSNMILAATVAKKNSAFTAQPSVSTGVLIQPKVSTLPSAVIKKSPIIKKQLTQGINVKASTLKRQVVKQPKLLGMPILKPKQATNKLRVGIPALNGKLMVPAVKNNTPMIGRHSQPLKSGFSPVLVRPNKPSKIKRLYDNKASGFAPIKRGGFASKPSGVIGGVVVSGSTGTAFGAGEEQIKKQADEDLQMQNITLKELRLSVRVSEGIVVTATVVAEPNDHSLSISWGDGQTETVTLKGPAISITDDNKTEFATVFQFNHVYKVPLGNFNKRIAIVSKNDRGRPLSSGSDTATLIPRYTLNFYSVILEFPDHLDSAAERYSEILANFKVTQGGQTVFDIRRKKSVLTNPALGSLSGESNIIDWRLINSSFSKEISVADEPLKLKLGIEEEDGLDGSGSSILTGIYDVLVAPARAIQWLAGVGSFDGSNFSDRSENPHLIHPSTSLNSSTAHSATVTFKVGDNEGYIHAHYAYDLTLIVPPQSDGQMLNAMVQ